MRSKLDSKFESFILFISISHQAQVLFSRNVQFDRQDEVRTQMPRTQTLKRRLWNRQMIRHKGLYGRGAGIGFSLKVKGSH